MKLTSTFVIIVKMFSLFLLLGIILANTVFISISIPVILLVLFGMFIKQPTGIIIKRVKTNDTIFSEEVFSNTIEISVNSGIGIVIICDKLPANFELVDGSNIKILWKGFKPKAEKIFYSIKCKAVGTYQLDCISLESRHFLHLREPIDETIADEQILEVKPRILDLKKLRNTTAASRIPLPLGAVSKIGIPTLEFKELKQYNPGDPFKYINWKATARNVCRGSTQPIINEYEKEGRKAVWIFLDNSDVMQFGTNIKNATNCSLEAVNGLADYYIKQNNIVALCTYNHADHFIYPGAGKKQYIKILKCILKMNVVVNKPKAPDEKTNFPALSLKDAIIRYKGYISGSRPLCVIVTRFTKDSANGLFEGIKEMSKYTGIVHGKLSIMVINISGYNLLSVEQAEGIGAKFLESRNNFLTCKIKSGVIWVDWDSAKSSFTKALLEQVVKR